MALLALGMEPLEHNMALLAMGMEPLEHSMVSPAWGWRPPEHSMGWSSTKASSLSEDSINPSSIFLSGLDPSYYFFYNVVYTPAMG